MLNIKKNVAGKDLTITLEGRLDTTTAPDLESVVKEMVPDAENLTIDIKDLAYISSAGLRVLLTAKKAMDKQGGNMVIKNASEEVMMIFDVTGFSEILNIE